MVAWLDRHHVGLSLLPAIVCVLAAVVALRATASTISLRPPSGPALRSAHRTGHAGRRAGSSATGRSAPRARRAAVVLVFHRAG